MDIRIATKEDAAMVLAIYAQYIDTPITFEYTLPSPEEFARRIGDTLTSYPYLLCFEEGKLCGYAYAGQLWERAAYQWGAELSVYLDSGMRSRGIGKTLYSVLIDILRLQGVKTVYGCVTTPNPRSERLHERLGFKTLGTFRRAGFKGNGWHDVTWFEKEIGNYDIPPAQIIPFALLPPEKINAVITSCIAGSR